MPSGRTTAAREIAADMSEKWGVEVSPLIVQIFIVFSKPVRESLNAFLNAQKAALNTQKAKLVRASLKGDALANELAKLQTATAIALQPITQLLQVLPLDTIINEIPGAEEIIGETYKDIKGEITFDKFSDTIAKIFPDFAEFLRTLTENVPVKVALTAISNTFGANYEFFDNVSNFADLRDATEDLEFRLARATALSSYAQAGSSYIDIQLRKVNIYLDIILTLNTSNL